MLAPVAYPWRGGVGWYTKLVAIPVIGPLLAYTITLPLAKAVPNAKLIVLPDVGHMVQNAAPELVISEIEAMICETMQRVAPTAAGPLH
jgi:pimeloyl-ACP methyl ester carboxylesterase